MTVKTELWINRILSLLTILVFVFIAIAGFSREDGAATSERFESKADLEYVNQQDNAIKADIIKDGAVHQVQHSAEYNAIQDQLELIIEYTKK